MGGMSQPLACQPGFHLKGEGMGLSSLVSELRWAGPLGAGPTLLSSNHKFPPQSCLAMWRQN